MAFLFTVPKKKRYLFNSDRTIVGAGFQILRDGMENYMTLVNGNAIGGNDCVGGE